MEAATVRTRRRGGKLIDAGLNVYDVLRRQTLVLTKDAVEAISARFAEKEAA